MSRTPDDGPIQMYEDPYDPIVSFSSPFANFVYEPHAEIPNYWVAVREKTAEELQAEKAVEAGERRRTRAREKAKESDDTRRTALYRLRDDAGQLLYIGISEDPLRRWPEHAKGKAWWPKVVDLSLEWFGSRTEAFAMEAAAIRSEQPLHNVVHNEQRTAT